MIKIIKQNNIDPCFARKMFAVLRQSNTDEANLTMVQALGSCLLQIPILIAGTILNILLSLAETMCQIWEDNLIPPQDRPS